MSTRSGADVDVAIIGAGVVGCATALALSRRGASVALLDAEPEPGLGASGTNSGILHTAFDSPPGELETELILRSAELRDAVLTALDVPVLRCGAIMGGRNAGEREALAQLAEMARRNGVEVTIRERDGALEIPGEAVTDPVAYTLGLAAAAARHGAALLMGFEVAALERRDGGLVLRDAGGARTLRCQIAVNSAGLGAGAVARLGGDDSFEIYPRKGEFLVFCRPGREPLERILLPVPTKRTKGVLVFPTIDGHVVAGPTAVDQQDERDWSVRPTARDEILPKAIEMYPPLADAEPIAAYAGLRPAGRGVNYVIGRSQRNPQLVNAAAIRSTGLTASLGIAERVCAIVGSMGVGLGTERALRPGTSPPLSGPWWRRTAEHRGA
jgi:glycerol-3-phosphate dehydrogenase